MREIDRLACAYWRTGDKDGKIQIAVKRLGYTLQEWKAALSRNRVD